MHIAYIYICNANSVGPTHMFPGCHPHDHPQHVIYQRNCSGCQCHNPPPGRARPPQIKQVWYCHHIFRKWKLQQSGMVTELIWKQLSNPWSPQYLFQKWGGREGLNPRLFGTFLKIHEGWLPWVFQQCCLIQKWLDEVDLQAWESWRFLYISSGSAFTASDWMCNMAPNHICCAYQISVWLVATKIGHYGPNQSVRKWVREAD